MVVQSQVDDAFNEAVTYARDYEGNFAFMVSMKARVMADLPISRNMVNAILRTKEHDIRVAAMRKTKTGVTVEVGEGIDLSVLPEGRTRYAVPNSDDTLTFIQVDRVTEGKWAGWIFVRQQISDWTERRGSQRPGNRYKGVWISLLQKVLDDPVRAMRAYGENLGICGRCGRTLTNDESRRYGIGPDCREIMGIA